METDYRMYIVVDYDLDMPSAKMSGQVGHAVSSYIYNKIMLRDIIEPKRTKEQLDDAIKFKNYMDTAQKKIILKGNKELCEKLEAEGYIPIRDKGLTVLEPNTLTCVNLGIYDIKGIEKWIQRLRLYPLESKETKRLHNALKEIKDIISTDGSMTDIYVHIEQAIGKD